MSTQPDTRPTTPATEAATTAAERLYGHLCEAYTARDLAAVLKDYDDALAEATSPVALDGETMYRAYWSAKWGTRTSRYCRWEQLTPSEQTIWRDAAARLTAEQEPIPMLCPNGHATCEGDHDD